MKLNRYQGSTLIFCVSLNKTQSSVRPARTGYRVVGRAVRVSHTLNDICIVDGERGCVGGWGERMNNNNCWEI